MNFSDINEAFDNSVKERVDNYNDERCRRQDDLYNNVEYERDEIMKSLNIDHSNKKDIYNELQKDLLPTAFSPREASDYFLEQNIVSNKTNYDSMLSYPDVKGTPVHNIKKSINKPDSKIKYPLLEQSDMSEYSDNDSVFSDIGSLPEVASQLTNGSRSTELPKIQKHKHDHEYYINKFISDIYNRDLTSKISSESDILSVDDNEIYKHIKKCNYCKDQIKAKFGGKQNIFEDFSNQIKDQFSRSDDNLGQSQFPNNWKELIIIILIGTVVILLMDFFIKIVKCI
jgi:hypothetical protein